VSKAIKLARTSARGGFNLFWGVAASSLISALGVILVARILSPSEYGLVAIALIAPNIIQIIRDLGIDQATIKYTAQYNQENKPANLKNVLAAGIIFELLLGSTLSVASYLLSGFLATTIFNRPEITPLIQIASFSIFGGALLKAAQAAFTGYEKMEYRSINLIVQSTFKAGLMILLVLLGLGAYGAIIGHTIASLIAGLTSIILLYMIVYKRLHKESNKLEFFVTIKKLLRYGLPISGSMILTGFLTQFYSFLIAIYLSDQIVGNYQAAINFAVLITFFVTPVTTTLFPVFSKVNPKTEPETLRSVFRFSVKYASLLVVPATFMLMALSKPAVFTLFGTKYEYTPLYLAIYIIFYLYTAFGHLSAGNILKGQGKTQLHLKITLIKSIIGVILSLTLIPTFGIFGFLAAYLAADVPSLSIILWWIKKHYNATIDWVSSAKILSASMIAAITTYAMVSVLYLANWINLIIGATIFLSTYLITAPLIGAINHADTKNLKEMLKALGPLAPIFNIPLYIIEKLTSILQKTKRHQ
jgi:O-antigen/teichoic acid export membrane protein